ncbi:fasciclin domain-containing protein [Brevifollis gellanilyticus]|uniref:Beta-Ig-H3/fasciclin n=1 Tax=Brevifollis gellanilyticus TaxID=748831 RepID=A0A512MC05_9BACT|nr:fasciclin domain-containing protein [Brevifollis gellanilyticus]GEP44269.1 beta-Ig-H3/fasciclin [Brevifollis gellanilyticus]
MKKLLLIGSLLGIFAGAASAADDIVATAKSAGTFKTLTAALDAAGKTEMLQEKGPYTVFAPSDEAFAKLPKGTVEELLKPENKEKLGKILAYHVVEGKVMAADVKTMKAKTANGAELDIKVEGEKVTVNDAKVVKADVPASNGVIHVIDTVLMPPMKK